MKNVQVASYEQLIVWQKAMDVVVEIYRVTERFPKYEFYGITSQMRRSAVSIPSNVAEGSRRGTKKDFRNFVLMAYGSGAELETQLKIVLRLGFVQQDECIKSLQLLDEVMRMLNVLSRRLGAEK